MLTSLKDHNVFVGKDFVFVKCDSIGRTATFNTNELVAEFIKLKFDNLFPESNFSDFTIDEALAKIDLIEPGVFSEEDIEDDGDDESPK